VRMIDIAYNTAARRQNNSPLVSVSRCPFIVRNATPQMQSNVLTTRDAFGNVFRKTDSSRGTKMMAVFSRNATVEAFVVFKPVISAVITAKKDAPNNIPCRKVLKRTCFRWHHPIGIKKRNAIRNRSPSRLNVPKLRIPILDIT